MVVAFEVLTFIACAALLMMGFVVAIIGFSNEEAGTGTAGLFLAVLGLVATISSANLNDGYDGVIHTQKQLTDEICHLKHGYYVDNTCYAHKPVQIKVK